MASTISFSHFFSYLTVSGECLAGMLVTLSALTIP